MVGAAVVGAIEGDVLGAEIEWWFYLTLVASYVSVVARTMERRCWLAAGGVDGASER